MTTTTFIKNYASACLAETARAHHDWLRRLDAAVCIPHLYGLTGTRMVLERIDGEQPGPTDLPIVAASLGHLHTTAHTRHLHAGRLDQPFQATPTLTLIDFVSPRIAALPQTLAISELPVALYKDSNIRNFILTDHKVAIIDFDELTLAPFGYDLAKLVVSAAMTHGPLSNELIEHTLNSYNSETASITDAYCDMRRFQTYTDIHHRLTVSYLDRHGYTHAWPDVRPWGRTLVS
ncbi:phosphotransferase [Nocardia sp. CNY236]|uniref:phosphotransferase n=1 Tax=Nocardia sp. CNY236 TaxID=1169152 RepID=UPI0006883745|nr:phosphotransferase [Nocardia sp. CNY236]